MALFWKAHLCCFFPAPIDVIHALIIATVVENFYLHIGIVSLIWSHT